MMAEAFRTIDRKMIFWRGHRCEGSEAHPGIRLLWTLCGHDVPADAAHLSDNEGELTCINCGLHLDAEKLESLKG